VTDNAKSAYENSTYKKYNDILNKYLPEWLAEHLHKKREQDESLTGIQPKICFQK
jgi:hypothetical protein